METPTKPINRVDADLKTWEKLEQYFAKRYGADVFNDRHSQKVKRDMYRHILRKYAGKPKNDLERAELKMLRAQHRGMNRRLYPNPWVRLARNTTVLVLNVGATGAKQLLKLLKFLINPTAGNNQQAAQPAQTAPAQQPAAAQQKNTGNQQSKSASKKTGQQQQPRGSQSKAAGQKQGAGKQPAGKQQQPAAQKQNQQQGRSTATVRKLNPRQMAPAGASKGMKRS